MGILKSHLGGKYLASSDLAGDGKEFGKVLTISGISEADVSRQDDPTSEIRPILEFEGDTKSLVLNKTNLSFVTGKFGEDDAKIVGCKIGVWVNPEVQYAGKLVQGLRLCDHKSIGNDGEEIPF